MRVSWKFMFVMIDISKMNKSHKSVMHDLAKIAYGITEYDFWMKNAREKRYTAPPPLPVKRRKKMKTKKKSPSSGLHKWNIEETWTLSLKELKWIRNIKESVVKNTNYISFDIKQITIIVN